MIAIAAAMALGFGAGCTGSLCNGTTLAPVFAKLDRMASPGGRTGRPIHILQIGDSHSAGDAITGAWRDVLQARYGSGGRGVLPPGRPYDGYITHGITAAMSPGWSIAADFGRAYSDPHPPLGLSAFSATSVAAGATMALDADAYERFDRLVVCAIARPGAGDLLLRIGLSTQRMDLGSTTNRPQCASVRSDAPVTHADLTTEGGPVTITSWAIFADEGGVTLSNLGVVGSQLIHFSRTDDAVLAEELRAYRPDLIVLAFGTNEGFSPRFGAFEYEIILRTQIGRLRRLAGNVPILLLGAPDALTRRSELRSNGGAAMDGAGCAETASSADSAASSAASTADRPGGFSGAMQRLGGYLGLTAAQEGSGGSPLSGNISAQSTTAPASGAVATTPSPARGSLFPPAALAEVREVQRRVAASLHVAFWDWNAAMGGRCTALRWARATPPLMRGDYVHYTSAGGREIAKRLQADLDKAGTE